ncbi:MAG: hypothetical protein HY231_17185 [Acidobacteria bacterium]|nr:hypothetical protein [Acidobacteriota bacterium]
MREKMKRHWLIMIVMFCAVAVIFATIVIRTGTADNRKYCNLYMGCSCKCKPGDDTRRGHDDHYDVKCPMCNNFARNKQKKNIRSGYFCPESNDWVD